MIAVHDFLHVPNIFGNVVPVIPAGVIDLCVVRELVSKKVMSLKCTCPPDRNFRLAVSS
jgi:hypothetical protein